MLKEITEQQSQVIESLMDQMSLEDKLGQVQCVNVSGMTDSQITEVVSKYKVGSFFIGNRTKERARQIVSVIERCQPKIPLIGNADLVNGAGARIEGLTVFPHQMGCSATDDPDLMYKMGEITAHEGLAYGIQWTFSPVMDICLNLQNPMMHIRTSGDDPKHIIKINSAIIKGYQENGMAATAKHFPGDGFDSRDTHITTLINDLDRETWMNTYGRIWKSAIDDGVMTIMGGHIALPFIDPEHEDEKQRYKGPRPATLSKKIQLDFLRGELGFDGCIVSDAINMIGLGAHMKRQEYGEKLLEAGSDMLLWTIPDYDTQEMKKSLEQGKLSMERLDDAVRRVLELKARVGLLEEYSLIPMLEEKNKKDFAGVAQSVADKSITLVRNELNNLPATWLKKGAKVLTITSQYIEGQRKKSDIEDLNAFDEALRERGFVVKHLVNPNGVNELKQIVDDYDAVFVNIKYPPRYGSIRLYGDSIEMFKGSWWVDNRKVIFTSFGDPYKLFDLPALHTYVNAYSNYSVSQKAAVKALLGEIPFLGKSPIELKGFIKREV